MRPNKSIKNAIHRRLATVAALFFFSGLSHHALALTFGAPELESGLGERLRVVLPLAGTAKEPLTVDCIKLNASANEPYDVSNLVRATLIQRASGQVVLLTTAQTMNEVVVSFEAGIGCGIWFSRRYTFFLDLPRDRPSAPTVVAPASPPVEPVVAAAATTGSTGKPPRRLRLRENGITPPAAVAAARPTAPASVVRRVRPEDEPGVLPRVRTRQPLAPPVRSLLKIDIGGIDDLLTGALRSPLEQSTGMRISNELGGNARPASAATTDAEFKQAHARYLAAMRDKPDPVTQENQALAQRLDAVAKDIASLKLELQTSAARAKELEASRVSWWWLLVAAVLSAAAAAGLILMLRKPPARQLILIDPDERPVRGRASVSKVAADGEGADGEGLPGNSVITETIAMSRGRQVDRAGRRARNEATQQHGGSESESTSQPAAATEDSAADDAARIKTTGPAAAIATGAMAIPFDLPPPPLALAASASSSDNAIKFSAPIAALRPAVQATDDAVLRVIPTLGTAGLKPDKNSLTQQLASMDHLSDESWASYRPPSDATGVALPFGTQGAAGSAKPAVNLVPIEVDPDVSHATSIELNFDLDAEMAEYEKSAARLQSAARVQPAAMFEFDPADAAAAVSVKSRPENNAPPAAGVAGADGGTDNSATQAVDLLNFDFDDPAADADRTERLRQRDPATVLAHQTNRPSSDQAVIMQVMMATASGVMESAQRQWETAGAAGAMKLLMPYLQLAPPNTPPGPWIMLAHVLRAEGMQSEYSAVAKTFLDRFGAALPEWDNAGSLASEQLGLARAPGLEIVAASQRGTAVLVGRLAGLAYRIDVPPEVLFDLQFHRQVLLLAAECSLGDQQSAPDVDLSL